eukprot:591562-Rhodomonas_salina.1
MPEHDTGFHIMRHLNKAADHAEKALQIRTKGYKGDFGQDFIRQSAEVRQKVMDAIAYETQETPEVPLGGGGGGELAFKNDRKVTFKESERS